MKNIVIDNTTYCISDSDYNKLHKAATDMDQGVESCDSCDNYLLIIDIIQSKYKPKLYIEDVFSTMF